MITLKQLKIYQKYEGDGDSLLRSGKPEEKELMNYSDWKIIEELIQDFNLLKKGYTSADYSEKTISKINENCDSAETVAEFKRLADKYVK